ncbi:MAG: hypothetical protein HY868_09130 [Chloroflexi bacterium]|nr:hypothetical protein [Chloroflexota bacterium]
MTKCFLVYLTIVLVLATGCGIQIDEHATETRVAAKIYATQTANAPTVTPQPTVTCPTPSVATRRSTTATQVYRTILTGKHLSEVSLGVSQLTNVPYIRFSLTQDGTDILSDFTLKHTDEYLGITVNKIVISSPIIRTPILESSGIIEGAYTLKEAREIKMLLESCPSVLEFVEFGNTPLPIGEIIQTTGF